MNLINYLINLKVNKICKQCNGDGINRDYKSLYIYRRKINYKKNVYVKCKNCNGSGKVDWIQNIIKPVFKLNIEPQEAFDHLNYIFKNIDGTDEYGDPIYILGGDFFNLEEVMKEYFRMYNLYIKDKVFEESIPGYCPDVLSHHFELFNDYNEQKLEN